MKLAILQFELLIRGSESLKDKRRVVKSVKDKLHHEHMVSVAEVGLLDRIDAARLGLAAVGSDVSKLQSMMDRIVEKLRHLHDAELGDCRREIVDGDALAPDERSEDGSPLWTDQEKRG